MMSFSNLLHNIPQEHLRVVTQYERVQDRMADKTTFYSLIFLPASGKSGCSSHQE
jgi:hypothetical protein